MLNLLNWFARGWIWFAKHVIYIINFRHNEDGSYTYGYESADGSFKIETKLPTGEVKGKYGFVDDVGKLRVVEYGATKYGFEPHGEGITVAPPTLVDETTQKDGSPNPYADQYYQQDAAPRPAPRPVQRPKPRPQQSFDSYSSPLQFAPAPQRNPNPAPQRPQAFPGASLTTDIEYAPQSRPQPSRGFAPQPQHQPQQQQHSFRPPQQSFSFEPAPIEEEDNYAEPPQRRPAPVQSFRPAPPPASRPAQVHSFQPSPPAPQYAPAPRPAPVTRQSGGGVGILDQLAKDYALPNGAPALHDISFGYY